MSRQGMHRDDKYRVQAYYEAHEKALFVLVAKLKIRRKYQFAVLNATECVNKNLDRLIAIARGVGK